MKHLDAGSEARIKAAAKSLAEAEGRMREAMDAAYPEGTRVGFRLSARQINLSWGVVVGTMLNEPRYLVVRLDGGHTTRAHHSEIRAMTAVVGRTHG